MKKDDLQSDVLPKYGTKTIFEANVLRKFVRGLKAYKNFINDEG